ncbi:MAG: XdhC family protein, partial [Pseudomonadota bacterium]
RAAPRGAAFVVLTYDHALDFLIAAEALKRSDAAYVGMIGSATKRAAFDGWMRREALEGAARLTCPIGAVGKGDKRPEVIAAHVAAEILTALSAPALASEPATYS